MYRLIRSALALLAIALAVTVLVDGQTRQGRDTFVAQGIGGAVSEAWSVRCVNAAGDAFVTCGDGAITGNVTVVGPAADGAAVSGNPVRIAGKDGSGNTQDLATDTNGILAVTGVLSHDGAAAAANRMAVLPAIAETGTLPTLTDGRNASLLVDVNAALFTRQIDPCSAGTPAPYVVNINTAATTEITPSLAGSGNHYYICAINLGPTAGAQNAALTDDDSDGCGSVSSGLAGGTTAATGWNFPANGGLTWGNGTGWIARTNGTNRVLCIVTSAAVQISGVIKAVAAP